MAIQTAPLATRRIAAFLLPLLLCACGIFSSPPPPPVLKPKHVQHLEPAPKLEATVIYRPDAYLLHLSLAELTLKTNPSDVSATAADFDIVRAYSLQKQESGTLQPVIILEYAFQGAPKHNHLVIPFAMPAESIDLSGLEETMVRLGPVPYTLYDLKVGVVAMPSLAPLGDEGNNATLAENMVESLLQPLIKNAVLFPPMIQGRVNLQLARFFIQHHYQEPAYFSIENAKQSLAAVDETATGEDTGALTREIEAQEALLHKTMPYSLGF